MVYLKGVRLTKLASNLQFYPTLAFTVMVLYVYTILKGFSDHSIQDFGHESCWKEKIIHVKGESKNVYEIEAEHQVIGNETVTHCKYTEKD